MVKDLLPDRDIIRVAERLWPSEIRVVIGHAGESRIEPRLMPLRDGEAKHAPGKH